MPHAVALLVLASTAHALGSLATGRPTSRVDRHADCAARRAQITRPHSWLGVSLIIKSPPRAAVGAPRTHACMSCAPSCDTPPTAPHAWVGPCICFGHFKCARRGPAGGGSSHRAARSAPFTATCHTNTFFLVDEVRAADGGVPCDELVRAPCSPAHAGSFGRGLDLLRCMHARARSSTRKLLRKPATQTPGEPAASALACV